MGSLAADVAYLLISRFDNHIGKYHENKSLLYCFKSFGWKFCSLTLLLLKSYHVVHTVRQMNSWGLLIPFLGVK